MPHARRDHDVVLLVLLVGGVGAERLGNRKSICLEKGTYTFILKQKKDKLVHICVIRTSSHRPPPPFPLFFQVTLSNLAYRSSIHPTTKTPTSPMDPPKCSLDPPLWPVTYHLSLVSWVCMFCQSTGRETSQWGISLLSGREQSCCHSDQRVVACCLSSQGLWLAYLAQRKVCN